jgi:hypothetical protein
MTIHEKIPCPGCARVAKPTFRARIIDDEWCIEICCSQCGHAAATVIDDPEIVEALTGGFMTGLSVDFDEDAVAPDK